MNPFQTLGLSRTATAKQIKSAARSLAMRWHPDKHRGDPRAAERFKTIIEARDQLLTKAGQLTPLARAERNRARVAPRSRQTHRRKQTRARVIIDDEVREFGDIGLALNELLRDILHRVGGNNPAVRQTIRNMKREAEGR